MCATVIFSILWLAFPQLGVGASAAAGECPEESARKRSFDEGNFDNCALSARLFSQGCAAGVTRRLGGGACVKREGCGMWWRRGRWPRVPYGCGGLPALTGIPDFRAGKLKNGPFGIWLHRQIDARDEMSGGKGCGSKQSNTRNVGDGRQDRILFPTQQGRIIAGVKYEKGKKERRKM